jgi:hypothetical protein
MDSGLCDVMHQIFLGKNNVSVVITSFRKNGQKPFYFTQDMICSGPISRRESKSTERILKKKEHEGYDRKLIWLETKILALYSMKKRKSYDFYKRLLSE